MIQTIQFAEEKTPRESWLKSSPKSQDIGRFENSAMDMIGLSWVFDSPEFCLATSERRCTDSG